MGESDVKCYKLLIIDLWVTEIGLYHDQIWSEKFEKMSRCFVISFLICNFGSGYSVASFPK